MTVLQQNFELERCPHCSVHKPMLPKLHKWDTQNHAGKYKRTWCTYICQNCGGVVLAAGTAFDQRATEIYPRTRSVDTDVPDRAREYLKQAIDSIHAPAGAVMLAASSVDAMLKEKNYQEGSLYSRIGQATEDHLITPEMAEWAHEVRLDANDQRHADNGASMPTEQDAQRVIDFTEALAQFLFVLPQQVQRGIESSSS